VDEPDLAAVSRHQPPTIPGRAFATRVEEIQAGGPELARAVERLMPQLTGDATAPGEDALVALLADPAVTFLVAWHDTSIVGIAMVAVYHSLSGTIAHLEDVVVDEPVRGLGAGEALVRTAVAVARTRGASRLELTSSPRRESANGLYQRLGFTRRETNVYRLDLEMASSRFQA
jgi:GNAT superfamily N-acetyltransferase